MMPEAEAAAKWWADVLRGPPLKDNGDLVQSMFGSLVAARAAPVSEEGIAAFEEALGARIEEVLDASDDWCMVDTDYGPGGVLSTALRRLDEETANAIRPLLPWKTIMVVKPGKVRVAKGYGAPEETIYGGEGH